MSVLKHGAIFQHFDRVWCFPLPIHWPCCVIAWVRACARGIFLAMSASVLL